MLIPIKYALLLPLLGVGEGLYRSVHLEKVKTGCFDQIWYGKVWCFELCTSLDLGDVRRNTRQGTIREYSGNKMR